jgi:hypothetical protein
LSVLSIHPVMDGIACHIVWLGYRFGIGRDNVRLNFEGKRYFDDMTVVIEISVYVCEESSPSAPRRRLRTPNPRRWNPYPSLSSRAAPPMPTTPYPHPQTRQHPSLLRPSSVPLQTPMASHADSARSGATRRPQTSSRAAPSTASAAGRSTNAIPAWR